MPVFSTVRARDRRPINEIGTNHEKVRAGSSRSRLSYIYKATHTRLHYILSTRLAGRHIKTYIYVIGSKHHTVCAWYAHICAHMKTTFWVAWAIFRRYKSKSNLSNANAARATKAVHIHVHSFSYTLTYTRHTRLWNVVIVNYIGVVSI